jgi:hypothetical protein
VQVYGNAVYAAGRNGNIVAMQTGRYRLELWRQDLNGTLSAAFHVDERGCFVPGEDRRVYALDPIAGRKLWDPFICQGPLRSDIQVSTQTVFQYAVQDKLYAINLVSGAQRWTLKEGRTVLAVMDGRVYLLDAAGMLRVVDEMLGTVQFTLPMNGFTLFLPNTTAPAVYAATADGLVSCIRPVEAGYMTIEMLYKEARVAASQPAEIKIPQPSTKPGKPGTPRKPPKKKPGEAGAEPAGGADAAPPAEGGEEKPAKPAKKPPKKPAGAEGAEPAGGAEAAPPAEGGEEKPAKPAKTTPKKPAKPAVEKPSGEDAPPAAEQ